MARILALNADPIRFKIEGPQWREGTTMKITVVTDEEQELEVEDGTTIETLLARRGINRETVAVSLNGALCTEEEPLKPGDRLKVIRVVTGG